MVLEDKSKSGKNQYKIDSKSNQMEVKSGKRQKVMQRKNKSKQKEGNFKGQVICTKKRGKAMPKTVCGFS